MKLENRKNCKAFTLIELLVVIGIIALLMSVMLPSLTRAKVQAKSMECMSNLRQLYFAFNCYAMDNDDYTMPTVCGSNGVYWWGQKLSDGIDHTRGFVWPYLKSELKKHSVYECPMQPYGNYKLQGRPANAPDNPKWITSTYGYNGYYLCPPASGWMELKQLPWKKVTAISGPGTLIVFADTMMDWDTSGSNPILTNIALLDPPYILAPSCLYWTKNISPTTSFRHNNRANVVFADGHCALKDLEDGEYTSPKLNIGSIGKDNSPYYVPDYKTWVKTRR